MHLIIKGSKKLNEKLITLCQKLCDKKSKKLKTEIENLSKKINAIS